MLNNLQVNKANYPSLSERVRAIPTQRTHKSQPKNALQATPQLDLKFRLTQRLVKPSSKNNIKKIKSQALSPEQARIQNKSSTPAFVENKSTMRKSLTFRTETKNNHFIFNPDFRFHVQSTNCQNGTTGRTAPLSNHSPQKMKIKTSGLLMDSIPMSMQKQISVEKSESKNKYIIHSNRKYSLNNDKQKLSAANEAEEQTFPLQKNFSADNEFTKFQFDQLKKYHVYYKGRRRIHNRSDFTDEEGFPIVQKGDSIAYRYQIIAQIGRGAFGKVYKAHDHKKRQNVALKIIRAIPKLTKQAKIQVQILQKVIKKDSEGRSNIVRMRGSFVFRSHSCISYQLLASNLYQYLKQNKFYSTSQDIIIKIAIQTLHALAFLADNKIVHCDIKPQNLMLKQSQKTGLRLIDLGSSCHEDQQFYTYIQSRYYRAPEVILGLRYTTAIDMWSFGCVLAEMHTGLPLFPGESQEQQLLMYIQLLGNPPNFMLEYGPRRKRFFNQNFQIRINQCGGRHRIAKGISFEKALNNCNDKQFVQFLKRCIEWEPEKRITPKQALLHEWILSGIPQNIRARHIVEVTGQGLQL